MGYREPRQTGQYRTQNRGNTESSPMQMGNYWQALFTYALKAIFNFI